jgi:hypothetical protein
MPALDLRKIAATTCVLTLLSSGACNDNKPANNNKAANNLVGDPLGGLALGAAFKVLGDKINEAIERATGAGLILEIQAGGQVELMIEQATAAFEHEQQLFWANLNTTQQNSISSIYAVANAFLNKTYQSVNDLETRAQTVIDSLPFAKNFPQAWHFGPAFAEATGTNPIRFAVTGHFYDLGRDGYDAELSINGAVPIKNIVKDYTSIAFEVPRTALKPASTNVGENQVTIRVPYQKGVIFHSKEFAEYKTVIGSLPQFVGTLTSTIKTTAAGPPAVQANLGPEDNQDSSDDDIACGGEHADLAIHLAYPTTGWRVQPSSVGWQLLWTQGDAGNDWDDHPRNCSTKLVACLCVTTRHKNFGTSGKLRFRVQFSEEHDTIITTPVSSDLKLSWGLIKTIDIPPTGAAAWSGSYAPFNGKPFDIPATGYEDDFISVQHSTPLQIVVRTAPFDKHFDLTKMQEAIAKKMAAR